MRTLASIAYGVVTWVLFVSLGTVLIAAACHTATLAARAF
jgi:hypothetical protein